MKPTELLPNFEQEATSILQKVWGYDGFRPLQLDIIRSISSGRDTVALLPTGGGKSITYQLPAMMMDGVVIVVTPLIALMTDQVKQLKALGISAVSVNSSMTHREIDIALDNCVYGDVKLLYISPERIETSIFRYRVQKMNASLIAVDEAHCISEWGYDFRPSYLKIVDLRELLPDVPIIAVTATATQAVLDDISQKLLLDDPNVFRSSFTRDNLSFVVRHAENKMEHILRVIDGVEGGSGIVYVRTRANAEKIAEQLKIQGISADFYHAGLNYRLRSRRQMEWSSGQTRVMVATNAFGMGIDKADVRFVIHHQLPQSVEAYYQEAGRAGRDGKRAYAVLLYNEQDKASTSRRIESEYPDKKTILDIYELIFNYIQVGIGSGKDEIYDFRLWEFATRNNLYTVTVLNAIKILELNGYFTLTDEMDNPTRIIFDVNRDELYRLQLKDRRIDTFIRILLRNYTGLFSQFVPIDEGYLSQISGYTEDHIVQMLLSLSRTHVIRYIPRRRSPLLILEEERLPRKDVVIAPSTYNKRKAQSQLKSAVMIEYAEQSEVCRSTLLRNYFDEDTTEQCGICDVCLEHRYRGESPKEQEQRIESVQNKILELLATYEYTLHTLMSEIPLDSSLALRELRHLISKGKVIQLNDGRLSLSPESRKPSKAKN